MLSISVFLFRLGNACLEPTLCLNVNKFEEFGAVPDAKSARRQIALVESKAFNPKLAILYTPSIPLNTPIKLPP